MDIQQTILSVPNDHLKHKRIHKEVTSISVLDFMTAISVLEYDSSVFSQYIVTRNNYVLSKQPIKSLN